MVETPSPLFRTEQVDGPSTAYSLSSYPSPEISQSVFKRRIPKQGDCFVPLSGTRNDFLRANGKFRINRNSVVDDYYLEESRKETKVAWRELDEPIG